MKRFDVVAAVKANARERIGQPKARTIILSKRDKMNRKRENNWRRFLKEGE